VFECSLQIIGDLLSQNFRIWKVLAVFQRIVFEPEDVEVGFVAFDDLVVGEAAPATVGLLFLGPIAAAFGSRVFGFVERYELVEVGSLERVGFEGEVLVGAEVVDPQLLGPRFFLSWFVLQEQHVGFDALSVEDARRQAEQSVDVTLLEQIRADGLSGSALEEDVVGDDDRSSAVDFQERLDVLDEIELFVLGARGVSI